MLSFRKAFAGAVSATAIAVSTLTLIPTIAGAEAPTSDVEAGKKIAMDRRKGNCIACHQMAGGEGPGNIGPPLVAMQARYPDQARLHAQIWDSTAANPASAMPPFGKHEILTEEQINQVVAYIMTL